MEISFSVAVGLKANTGHFEDLHWLTEEGAVHARSIWCLSPQAFKLQVGPKAYMLLVFAKCSSLYELV